MPWQWWLADPGSGCVHAWVVNGPGWPGAGSRRGVAVISRDLTRTYSGRCMECIGLGSAIEQVNRYGAFI